MDAVGKPLDWDDEIEKESSFVELPPGDYDFVIDHIEKGMHNGSDKIPACKKVTVYFNILSADGQTAQIRQDYILWSTLEWKISELFLGVGLKKQGERVRMVWESLAGCTGRCEVTLDQDKKDPSKKYNHIKKLYPKETKTWQGGFR